MFTLAENQPCTLDSDCHANGECNQGQCRCQKGYVGDGVRDCVGKLKMNTVPFSISRGIFSPKNSMKRRPVAHPKGPGMGLFCGFITGTNFHLLPFRNVFNIELHLAAIYRKVIVITFATVRSRYDIVCSTSYRPARVMILAVKQSNNNTINFLKDTQKRHP